MANTLERFMVTSRVTGKNITTGRNYDAYVDNGGSFRVIDNTTRANKYGINAVTFPSEDFKREVLELIKSIKGTTPTTGSGRKGYFPRKGANGSTPAPVVVGSPEEIVIEVIDVSGATPVTYGEKPETKSKSKTTTSVPIMAKEAEKPSVLLNPKATPEEIEAYVRAELGTVSGLGKDTIDSLVPSITRELLSDALKVPGGVPGVGTATAIDALTSASLSPAAKEVLDGLKLEPTGSPVVPPKRTTTPSKSTSTTKSPTFKDFLNSQGVSTDLLKDVKAFREEHGMVDDVLAKRIPKVEPTDLFQGGEQWTQSIIAILEGRHLNFVGEKATGKNVLATSLAALFFRPIWDIGCHVNTDAASLIGTDTFVSGEVKLRPGSITECAMAGGFGVLDEINMARNEVLAVLHAATDDRRVIEIPGYERIKLHPATRFIATMNSGYAGTRTLNEALVSRFTVIRFKSLEIKQIVALFKDKCPDMKETALTAMANLFHALNDKAQSGEIGTEAVDLRGMVSALRMIEHGLRPYEAVMVNVTNKVFDDHVWKVVDDAVKVHIPVAMPVTNFVGMSKSMTVDFSSL